MKIACGPRSGMIFMVFVASGLIDFHNFRRTLYELVLRSYMSYQLQIRPGHLQSFILTTSESVPIRRSRAYYFQILRFSDSSILYSQILRFPDAQFLRLYDSQTLRFSDSQTLRFSDSQTRRLPDPQTARLSGSQTLRLPDS